jgi:hypothetical protein
MAERNVESTQPQPPAPPLPQAQPQTHFRDVAFTGFEPSDCGSNLFRLWKGQFIGVRSDSEEFSIDVSFKQSDTPYVTGPIVEGALVMLMSYRACKCKPSRKLVCPAHAEAVAVE